MTTKPDIKPLPPPASVGERAQATRCAADLSMLCATHYDDVQWCIRCDDVTFCQRHWEIIVKCKWNLYEQRERNASLPHRP